MALHFAEKEPFASSENTPAGSQPVFVAAKAESYVVAVDTLGKLRWASGDLDGDHLICVVSERVRASYLAYLREKGISYVVAGESTVDLPKAMDLLGEHFGIRLHGHLSLSGRDLKSHSAALRTASLPVLCTPSALIVILMNIPHGHARQPPCSAQLRAGCAVWHDCSTEAGGIVRNYFYAAQLCNQLKHSS